MRRAGAGRQPHDESVSLADHGNGATGAFLAETHVSDGPAALNQTTGTIESLNDTALTLGVANGEDKIHDAKYEAAIAAPKDELEGMMASTKRIRSNGALPV
jgi:hypothetical protein